MKKKSKKEILITIAGGVALCGMLGTMTGCFSKVEGFDTVDVLYGFSQLETPEGCLTCFGCINTNSSDGGCCGGPTYSYIGCVDCFGCTTKDDTNSEDVYMIYELCGGYYCVNLPMNSEGKVIPMYGCFKMKE